MVFWSEPTTTEDEAVTAISEHDTDEDDVLLDDKDEDEDTAAEEADVGKDESAAEEDEDEGSCGVTWDDAEEFSAAVLLASIPRTATAKLAAAVALLGYLVYMKARLDKCVA